MVFSLHSLRGRIVSSHVVIAARRASKSGRRRSCPGILRPAAVRTGRAVGLPGALVAPDTCDRAVLEIDRFANDELPLGVAIQIGRRDVRVVVEDDQRKPEIAVQLADKMIQSEKVDVMTGIIWSNLAMAVVPAATAAWRKFRRELRVFIGDSGSE